MKQIVKITGTLVSITLITLILLEILLQVALPALPRIIAQRVPQYPVRYGIQFDTPHGAREYPANESVTMTIGSGTGDLYAISCLDPLTAPPITPETIIYTRDNRGFRNPTPYPDKVNLVIVGDSFTAAENIQRPYWDDLSDSMLVFGLPGSGTEEQRLLLEHFGLPRQPEHVILAFFGGNDMTDTGHFNEVKRAGYNLYDYGNRNRKPWEYLVTFHLFMFVKESLDSSDSNDRCPYPITVNNGQSTALYDAFVAGVAQEPLTNTSLWQETTDAITNIATQVIDSGGQFTLMYIPYKAEVYAPLLSESDQNAIAERLNIDWSLVDQQPALLATLADETGFTFLDLTPILRSAIQAGNEPYFYADTHWNQQGHDLVNSFLQDYLR